MSKFGDPVIVAEFEEDRKRCCGKLNYRGASLIVATLEVGYWFYYLIFLIFACINHRQAWSIVILSVNLAILTLQVIAVFYAIIRRKHRLLQMHLVFLCLTLVWDLAMSVGFFAMAVFPSALDGKIITYKGREWSARVFGLVMGSLLVLWFAGRFISTVILYRYWKILRESEKRAKEIPLKRGQRQVTFEEDLLESSLPAAFI